MNEVVKRKFPGILWILPICFGIVGGTIAAFIASMKYQASWWELFTVGVLISLFPIIVWLIFVVEIFSSL